MAIKLGQGFQITSSSVIDTRLVLTKAEMIAVNDNLMPDKYFALCSDDNLMYIYDKSRTPSTETGKFYAASSSSELLLRGYYYNNNFYIDAEHTVPMIKDVKYIYVDKHELGAIYTYDGENFNLPVKIDNKSIIKGEYGLQLPGYYTATRGQIPTKHNTNGLEWIDPDSALSRDEIIEVLK